MHRLKKYGSWNWHSATGFMSILTFRHFWSALTFSDFYVLPMFWNLIFTSFFIWLFPSFFFYLCSDRCFIASRSFCLEIVQIYTRTYIHRNGAIQIYVLWEFAVLIQYAWGIKFAFTIRFYVIMLNFVYFESTLVFLLSSKQKFPKAENRRGSCIMFNDFYVLGFFFIKCIGM